MPLPTQAPSAAVLPDFDALDPLGAQPASAAAPPNAATADPVMNDLLEIFSMMDNPSPRFPPGFIPPAPYRRGCCAPLARSQSILDASFCLLAVLVKSVTQK
jgi:hypothetical protein